MDKPRWSYKHPERWDRLILHYNFLKKVEGEHGILWCEYCGKDSLVIYPWNKVPNRSDMATVDHFLPKSKYPHFANDEENFVIACSSCNEKKKDDLWEEETLKYSRIKK